jgi:hypothetical protein
MDTIVSRLDVTQIFCEVDDFYQSFEQMWQQQPQLPSSWENGEVSLGCV